MALGLSLDKLIAPLKSLAKVGAERVAKGEHLRVVADDVATAHFGPPEARGAFLGRFGAVLGELAIVARGNPSVYHCRPSASRVVHETDLLSIPTEPPVALQRPGIVEVRRPETGERLWGDVVSLGWFTVEGRWLTPRRLLPATVLVGITYPDVIAVALWSPTWSGEELDEQLPRPHFGSDLVEAVEALEHHAFAKAAARYLVVFGLLAQIPDGPLRFEIDKQTGKRNVWIRETKKSPKKPNAAASADERVRVLGDTEITGHIRRVRTGEGWKNVEYRYIQGYTGKRWFGPRYVVERDFQHTGLANETLVYRGRKS